MAFNRLSDVGTRHIQSIRRTWILHSLDSVLDTRGHWSCALSKIIGFARSIFWGSMIRGSGINLETEVHAEKEEHISTLLDMLVKLVL